MISQDTGDDCLKLLFGACQRIRDGQPSQLFWNHAQPLRTCLQKGSLSCAEFDRDLHLFSLAHSTGKPPALRAIDSLGRRNRCKIGFLVLASRRIREQSLGSVVGQHDLSIE